jgi:uroporphyrinogen-III decarboxylase
MLLGEPAISEINAILETKLQQFMPEVAQLPGQIIFSPDNLDGQFISPPVFEEYLADSYRLTAEVLHAQGKHLLVHVGGPIKHLLALMAEVGIDGLEGIAGIPQSNASLTAAREVVGPEMTLWGGIPQDLLLNTHDEQAFEAAVRQAVEETLEDGRMILGVADRMPVKAELSRLEAIPSLIKRA